MNADPAPCRVGVGDYDHTRDLVSGTVAVKGVTFTAFDRPEDLFESFLEASEFDAAELSLAVCAVLAGAGQERFCVLPVFPARSFRHGAIYVAADGPGTPAELAGARIGIPVWVQTAGVYVRGILATRYGLRLEDINWVYAGVDVPGRREPVAFDPGPYRISYLTDATLDQLLLERRVEAVISARPPASIEREDPLVRRLFDDPATQDRDYFSDTGVFPIMHVLAVRRERIEAEPELAARLMAGFELAKDRSLRRALEATVPSFPLPWTARHARDARSVLGEDFWPYGLEPNRKAIDAFLDFAAAQRLTPRRLSSEELFPRLALPRPGR